MGAYDYGNGSSRERLALISSLFTQWLGLPHEAPLLGGAGRAGRDAIDGGDLGHGRTLARACVRCGRTRSPPCGAGRGTARSVVEGLPDAPRCTVNSRSHPNDAAPFSLIPTP